MPDAPEDDRPEVGPASTMRQYRLTAIERADLLRAVMARITVLNDPAVRAADAHEGYRLRQLLERFSD